MPVIPGDKRCHHTLLDPARRFIALLDGSGESADVIYWPLSSRFPPG